MFSYFLPPNIAVTIFKVTKKLTESHSKYLYTQDLDSTINMSPCLPYHISSARPVAKACKIPKRQLLSFQATVLFCSLGKKHSWKRKETHSYVKMQRTNIPTLKFTPAVLDNKNIGHVFCIYFSMVFIYFRYSNKA